MYFFFGVIYHLYFPCSSLKRVDGQRGDSAGTARGQRIPDTHSGVYRVYTGGGLPGPIFCLQGPPAKWGVDLF